MDRNSIQKNGGEVAGLLASLRAVAEPSRLRILALCAQGELTVSELVDVLGQSQPRVSRHLKVLAEAGLLERLREGTWVFYRLTRRGRDADVARGLLALAPGRDPRYWHRHRSHVGSLGTVRPTRPGHRPIDGDACRGA